MGTFIDIKGQIFGDWKAISYLGGSLWMCQNIYTKETKKIHSYSLRKIITNTENHKSKEEQPKDLTDRTFGEYKVVDYNKETGKWICKCSCGNITEVKAFDLINKKSTRCKNPIHKLKHNYTGEIIKGWEVMGYAGEMKWHCKCTCGCGEEKDVLSKYLKTEEVGLCTKRSIPVRHRVIKDISGQIFNHLKVIRYTGKDQMWECECLACGRHVEIFRDSIVTGKTKSCGCLKETMRAQTLLQRYGDTNTSRINNPREAWQIETVSNRDKLKSFIDSFEGTPTLIQVSQLLGINDTSLAKALNKFGLDYYIVHNSGVSDIELSLLNEIKKYGYEVITNDRTIIHGQELDIYIPDKKLAFEFNGNYWHSSIFKPKDYHQQKTIACAKQGIHLVHIFEYEWKNIDTQEKIRYHIDNLLNDDKIVIPGRKTRVQQINSTESKDFLEKYHLQGNAQSSIQLGCFYNDDLIGVMTFGISRFNEDCIELIRLCWKQSYRVIGGTNKLFKYAIDKYKFSNIVSYCNISKFNGQCYFNMGFKFDCLTKPSYVWVNTGSQQVLTRYQTMKQYLVKNGLGRQDQTEDEIMENIGFVKIYNSGNMKLIHKTS